MSNRIRGKFRPGRTQQRVISHEVVALLRWGSIASSTSIILRNHPISGSQQKSRVASSNRSNGKNSPKILEKQNGDVEVSVSSKDEVSSYTVGRDFWSAYQESLREREEVYRRLAES